jgi:hypothetical protein
VAMTDEQLAEVLKRADELVIGAMNEDARRGAGAPRRLRTRAGGGPREQVVHRVRPADQAPEGRERALQGAGRRGDGVGRSNVDRRKGTASAEGTLRSVDGPRRYLRIPLRLSTVANAHHKLREVGLRLPHPYLLGPIYLQRIEQVISTRSAPALHACANRRDYL